MKEAARAIRDLGPENVVVKGGHLENIAADILYDGREFTELRVERIDTKNTHGTGCIFASAIAANLAHKKTVRESVTASKDFITAANPCWPRDWEGLRTGQSDGHAVPQGGVGRLSGGHAPTLRAGSPSFCGFRNVDMLVPHERL